MTRPRSPIEQMVDAACGVTWRPEPEGPPEPPQDGVLLICERCGRKQWDERVPAYFDFSVVMSVCPNHRRRHVAMRALSCT